MRRFQGVQWSRIRYDTPVSFEEVIRLGKSICNQINRIDIEEDDDEEIRADILSTLPALSRMLTGITSTINTAIKNKEIKLEYEGERKFSAFIRVGLYYISEEIKKLETDYLVASGRTTKGGLLKCANFVESVVCLIYDSIHEAMKLEPSDRYRFYYALWTGLTERIFFYMKPMTSGSTDLKNSGGFIDYSEFLEKTEKSGGQSLKQLDDIKNADDMLKILTGGGGLS